MKLMIALLFIILTVPALAQFGGFGGSGGHSQITGDPDSVLINVPTKVSGTLDVLDQLTISASAPTIQFDNGGGTVWNIGESTTGGGNVFEIKQGSQGRLKIASGGDVIVNAVAGSFGVGTASPVELFSIGGTNGEQTSSSFASTELTGMTGPSVDATGIIPAGVFIWGVLIRVTTTITGATSFSIGTVTDPDRWGSGIALTAGTTTGVTDYTATGFGQFDASGDDVKLTAAGPDFTAGAVRIVVYLVTMTAPTG